MATPIIPQLTPFQIVQYYANLLIKQYKGKPKAYATVASTVAPIIMPQISVQQVSFSDIAASGVFVLSYNGNPTSNINWNDNTATIQSKLQAVSGLNSVTVTGTIAGQSLSITFTGVLPPVQLLQVTSNSLLTSGSLGMSIGVTEIDQTLPIQVQNAFNLIGSNPAIGVQLDVIGKYCGVTRTGNGPNGPITLNDADFLTLIKFAIVQNNAGSSLEDIEANLNMFWPGLFLVTDYQNMHMSYILAATIGSVNLFDLLVSEKLIPKPMAVQISVIIPPVVDIFFGFSTYNGLNNFVKPFNTYDSFNLTWKWLSYSDAIFV
jgi:Protein of unknown function (DUF2612)